MRWEEWWEEEKQRSRQDDRRRQPDMETPGQRERQVRAVVRLLTSESAHLLLPVAWASHLPWLGLGFYICKMGILVVLASLGDCGD